MGSDSRLMVLKSVNYLILVATPFKLMRYYPDITPERLFLNRQHVNGLDEQFDRISLFEIQIVD
jgi:hypothetical protein